MKMKNKDFLENKPAQDLLNWFYENPRQMPWRVIGGAHPNPYHVWISEIMLQQTTVKTVAGYFEKWMQRFPDVFTLAQADLEDVLLQWQGLGYYTRARKIHECAQVICQKYNGVIPNERTELLKLPGIGPYSASSICAFAYNKPETVVDANVIRVIARLYALTHQVTKEEIYQLAQKITPKDKGADYASAIMDLGALICTATQAKCDSCPWQKYCSAYQKNLVDKIPLIQKPEKKIKEGYVYLIQNMKGAFYIRKRADKGLLANLYEFPWQEGDLPLFDAEWIEKKQVITHTFTHFKLTLKVRYIQLPDSHVALKDGHFVFPKDFNEYPFSTLMQKVIAKAL